MEFISLLNLTSQETLMADTCTKAPEEIYRCHCYFNLTFTRTGQENLRCCSDSRDPVCERGHQFPILVTGTKFGQVYNTF